MNLRSYSLPPVTVCALLLATVMPVQAQSDEPEERSRERSEAPRSERGDPPPATRRSSLSDAVRRVQRETGGQVLGAERVQFDGRDINRIKVMDDRGRIRYMDDDPQGDRQERGRARGEPPPPRRDNPPKP